MVHNVIIHIHVVSWTFLSNAPKIFSYIICFQMDQFQPGSGNSHANKQMDFLNKCKGYNIIRFRSCTQTHYFSFMAVHKVSLDVPLFHPESHTTQQQQQKTYPARKKLKYIHSNVPMLLFVFLSCIFDQCQFAVLQAGRSSP